MAGASIDDRQLAYLDNETGALTTILRKFQQQQDGVLPAKVIDYDRVRNRARVEIMIQIVASDNKVAARAQISAVPVLQLGAGGFVISFPVAKGDTGWLLANDRDISNFLETMDTAIPNTYRMKKFSDAIFIPDQITSTTDPADVDNLVIQKTDGTVKITFTDDSINIDTANEVNVTTEHATITANIEATITSPEVTVAASTSVTLDTPLTTMTGDATINGSLQVDTDFTVDGDAALGGSGGKDIARKGDAVAGGVITVGSTKHTAT